MPAAARSSSPEASLPLPVGGWRPHAVLDSAAPAAARRPLAAPGSIARTQRKLREISFPDPRGWSPAQVFAVVASITGLPRSACKTRPRRRNRRVRSTVAEVAKTFGRAERNSWRVSLPPLTFVFRRLARLQSAQPCQPNHRAIRIVEGPGRAALSVSPQARWKRKTQPNSSFAPSYPMYDLRRHSGP